MANMDNTQKKPVNTFLKPPMVFFYGSFQERMPLYKYLQNRHRQNKLHRSQ
jgi:hypothetical protein